MGRPIQDKWFTVEDGAAGANLSLTTTSGVEAIISQKGTSKYKVASGIVRLVDGAPASADEAQLIHEGRNVRKIAQYRVYYFDDADPSTEDSGVWRDGAGAVVGTFVPAMLPEGDVTATATVTVSDGAVDDAFTITEGGSGYGSAPAVTVSAPNGTSAVLGVVTDDGNTITAIAITDGGSGYVSAPAITITGGSGDATATAVLTDGVVTGVNVTNSGTGYNGDGGASIEAVVLTQATATATLTGDAVSAVNLGTAGAGYTSATVSIAAP